MKTFAIANHKGGSAKTTTTVNLAAALGELGRRVLVIDLDPQGSATGWLGLPLGGHSILDAYLSRADLSRIATSTSAPGVDLVPSSPWLVAADRSEEVAIGLGIIGTFERLERQWDYILVDCPPSQGSLTIAILSVCPSVIIPVETRVLALSGLVSLLGTMDLVRDRLNPELTIEAIIACRVNRTRHASEVVDRLRERYPGLVLNVAVRESVSLAEAPSFQLPITRYAPNSTGAKDYRAVAREILDREGLADEMAAIPVVEEIAKPLLSEPMPSRTLSEVETRRSRPVRAIERRDVRQYSDGADTVSAATDRSRSDGNGGHSVKDAIRRKVAGKVRRRPSP